MKAITTAVLAFMIVNFASAKTYVLESGKWTDAKVWNNQYPGTTIGPNDIVIIKGQVVLTAPIIIEGTLEVEKGAYMLGMQTLLISKTGKFVNNGNTVAKQIVNEGSMSNNMIIEAKGDADNLGSIDNNNLISAGHNFNNMRGSAAGKGGLYVADNNIKSSPEATFGSGVRFIVGNETEKSLSAEKR